MSSLTPEEIAYYQTHADDDLRPSLLAADVVGIVLAFAAVVTRVLARICSKARFGWDDYLIFVALMGQLSYAIVMFLDVANGKGRHIIFVKDQKLSAQYLVAAIISYSITVMLTKISILFLYHRVFPVQWLLLVAYFVGAVVISYNLAVIFVAAFQCIPLSALWTGNPGTCIDISPPFTALAIVNVITDIAILALPVHPVLGLQMRRTRKIQILTIFLLGGIVCIFGIIRAVVIATMTIVDFSYNGVSSCIWSYIELSVGILAACMPTFGPLLQHKRRRRIGTEPKPCRSDSGSGSGSKTSPRWKKLAVDRVREVPSDDSILLTEVSCRLGRENHDTWTGSASGWGLGYGDYDATMREGCYSERGKGGEENQGSIVAQEDERRSVYSV